MTEAEWSACTLLHPMEDWLEGRAGVRKLLLFACGCCRRAWDLLPDERSRRAVAVTERFADGAASERELADAAAGAAVAEGEAAEAASVLIGQGGERPDPLRAFAVAYAAALACGRAAWGAAAGASNPGELLVRGLELSRLIESAGAASAVAHYAEEAAQCELLRDVLGFSPFRAAATIEPSVLGWNGGTVPKLARAIYDARDFGRLPLLADALEHAGCADAPLLGHLRGPGPHVRGCYALDLLLGKE
jgi:hypothetical protein